MDIAIMLALAILLLGAKVLGYVFERLKFSSLVGEIIAGIIIGPVLGLVVPSEGIAEFAGLGILFFLFLIGLSTKFEELGENVYESSIIALGGALFSFAVGFLIGWLAFGSVIMGIFLGVALISTSTAMSVRALVDTGRFHTRAGKTMLGVALADDIIALLALALLTTYMTFGAVKIWEIATLFFAVMGFMLIILTVGSRVVGGLLSLFSSIKDEYILVTASIAILFIIAFVSEHIGIAAVTGAFLAGMAMSKSSVTETNIIPKVKTIGYGLFIPLFFAYSAISFNIEAFFGYFWLIIALVALAVVTKAFGCGHVSGLFGFRGVEKRVIGFGMIPRGEYSIIAAQLALTAGIIAAPIYTVVLSFVIITIMVTPILIRVFAKD
jgi:Kef-type K+ transport system membrane component KefB